MAADDSHAENDQEMIAKLNLFSLLAPSRLFARFSDDRWSVNLSLRCMDMAYKEQSTLSVKGGFSSYGSAWSGSVPMLCFTVRLLFFKYN